MQDCSSLCFDTVLSICQNEKKDHRVKIAWKFWEQLIHFLKWIFKSLFSLCFSGGGNGRDIHLLGDRVLSTPLGQFDSVQSSLSPENQSLQNALEVSWTSSFSSWVTATKPSCGISMDPFGTQDLQGLLLVLGLAVVMNAIPFLGGGPTRVLGPFTGQG